MHGFARWVVWGIILLLFIDNLDRALEIIIQPEVDLLYKDVYHELHVCVRSETSKWCEKKHSVKCSLDGLDKYYEKQFSELLEVSEIPSGSYQVQCGWNDSVPPTRRYLLIFDKHNVRLDCSAAPRFVHYETKWPSFPWCCSRPMVDPKWLRRFPIRSIQLCGATKCKSDLDLLKFQREWIRLKPQAPIKASKALIKCEENFSRTVYFLSKPIQVQYIPINKSSTILPLEIYVSL